MGFKVKRWGSYGTVDVRDYYAGAKSVGGYDTRSYVHAFNGRLVFLCYDEDDDSVWFTFDPASETWTGPHEGPTSGGHWCHWSGFDGDSYNYGKFGEDYLVGYGMFSGTLWSNVYLRYFTPAFTFHQIDAHDYLPDGVTDPSFWGGGVGIGVRDGKPCRLAHLFYKPPGWFTSQHDVVVYGIDGLLTRLDATADDLYFRDYWNTEQAYGSGYTLDVDGCGDDGEWYYAAFPATTDKCSWTSKLNVESSHAGHVYLVGGVAYGLINNHNVDPHTHYYADLDDITTPVTLPFSGTWDYRRQRDGLAFALDEGDLDGISHGVNVPMDVDPTYNASLGYYVGMSGNTGIVTSVYLLDPHQKVSWAGWPGVAGKGSIAWVGEAGINTKMVLNEVLPLGRAASLSARAAVEAWDRIYVQDAVVAKATQAPTPLAVWLDGYPTNDPDWWFPGSDGDHYDGFWDIFAHDGTNLVIARMPDPSWGALSPLGADVLYSMGRAREDSDLSVTLRNSMKVDATTFAGPITGSYHRQLIGCRDLKQLVWLESNTGGFQSPPEWEAKVGHLVQTSATHWDWVTDIDFKNREPGLGEDGDSHESWTVWCVQPIPPCRPLSKGGWLVGATLYFRPWGNTWAWDAGSRDATFRDSGLGHVPSLPSYLGPVPVENAPAYYVDLDEWTQARALYGADALLVYDETGAFVECLSDETTYPANGKAFAIAPGPVPKVIYRVYRWSQYSDSAEYWGCWQDGAGDDDLNVGMWACYDLFSGATITPGFGAFRGFIDSSGVATNNLEALPWRWDTIAANLYGSTYPKSIYPAPGSGEMRAGTGGFSLSPLPGGPSSGRNGVRGVGSRA